MSITIPKGISTIYYTGPNDVSLDPYKNNINQVFEIYDEGVWFKLYNPSLPDFSEFSSLTSSLSYQFFAYSEFIITV
jgi:hypothetical protein